MVFYRAISSISIYIYVYSTRSFYRSLASNSLRIPWAMSLSVDQGQDTISGEFTVAPSLRGNGPFTGNVSSNGSFKFIVHSNDTIAPLLFEGVLQPDGSLSGSYCSVNQQIQCDTSAGGHGVWSVTKTT
jgi:eukaryotic-like serine/threonine-protein kinase